MKLKGFLVALVAILLLAGCSKSDDSNAPILIGVAGAHSGDLAPYGLPTVNAVELVVEEWNKNGGVLGREIKIIVEDDGCKPELASNVASKLVGEKVIGVIGHICSGATKAAMGIYRDSKIIAISPSATNPDLTAGNYPNFFRTIAPDDAQAAVEVELIKKLGLKKVAILHDKGDYGKGFATFVKDMIEADGSVEIKLFEGITVGAVDYSAILNKVSGSDVDAIVFGGYHPEASKLVAQIKKMKLDIPFLSDDGVKDNTFIKVAGEYAEGVYATGPIDTSSSAAAQKALQMHKDKYGEEAGTFFLNAFAATESLLKAIEKAKSTDYDAIRNALIDIKVETTLGNIGFDTTGNPEGVGFAGFQVVNGVYIEVK
ncbi:MAG: branched chain amino acid ABC transporter substrate-binding protein [Spirochaetaceae bacterium 4572_7]|nr:MAG: branched chain amino acid ABC transporter substrate-binding protein [Spirochaetaceae bacterium 4572_7]